MSIPDTYDGIYFVPVDGDDDLLCVKYWDFTDEYANGKPIDGNSKGDKYHIALFTKGEDDNPVFNDAFEAILFHPPTYIKQLEGTGIYGTIVRKTDKSEIWFEKYLIEKTGRDILHKLNNLLKKVTGDDDND